MSLYLGENLISGVATPTEPTRNLGQIIESLVPLTDAGLHLLDGALINGSGIYSAFATYIAGLVSSYPDLFDTEANWQQSVTDYGVCGKFVYDATANTVRLPKVTGIIEGTTDVTALGDLIEAGLPNITGTVDWSNGGQGHTELGTANGAFARVANTNVTYPSAGGTTSNARGFTIDASRSNHIYGNSTTVQPQTIKAFYYIVIATSTKTDIQVDIDEIATDLNGKADTDLSNVPTSKGILSESYVNGTSWYRVYADGWCEQGGLTATEASNSTIYFLKPYIDTNYTVSVNSYRVNSGSGDATEYGMTVGNFTVDSFYAVIQSGTRRYIWRACGYIR